MDTLTLVAVRGRMLVGPEFRELESLVEELIDVTRSFEDWQRKELPRLNAMLAAKQLKPIP